MTKQRTRRPQRLLIVLAAVMALLGLEWWRSLESIGVTTYQAVSSKLDAPVTAVLVVDLHDHLFGSGGERLLAEVSAQEPDIILFPGDGLNGYSGSDGRLCALVENLRHIAPVYFSIGNHELRYMYLQKSSGLLDRLRQAGALVLDRAYADITANGQALRIGGLFDYVYNEDGSADWPESASYRFLMDFEDTDAYKLLLAHQPDFLINDAADARWDIDLAVCGHEHGGQIRLPLIGGFFSTHLGFFSPYLDGAHLINGIPTVISRGLGTYGPLFPGGAVPPRLFNAPELVRLELLPGKDAA